MVLNESSTPFEQVQQILSQYTDRNPGTTQAVANMVRSSLEEFGDTAPQFIEKLTCNLESQTQTALTVEDEQKIIRLGAIARDTEQKRVKRWGALSLLGALATTCVTEAEHNEALSHTTVAANSARFVLATISNNDEEPPFREASNAFLKQCGTSTEDLALELLEHDIVSTKNARENIHEQSAVQGQGKEYIRRLSEPYPIDISSLGEKAVKKIQCMSWLSLDEASQVTARDLYNESRHIATILDLTEHSTRLHKIKKDFEEYQTGRLWASMSTAVTQHLQKHIAPHIDHKNLAIFFSKNCARSENFLRIYYTLLGANTANIPLVGLLGACRTVKNHYNLLKILRYSPHNRSREFYR